MEPHLIERRPSWWLLYAIAAVMVVLVALVETSVHNEGARMTLEIVVVIAIFALMLRWIRANRGRIELSEAAKTQRPAVETALTNGVSLVDTRTVGVRGAGPRSVDAGRRRPIRSEQPRGALTPFAVTGRQRHGGPPSRRPARA
jgi:hypothetical protein